ncbi:hypothetical protein VaNZ11_009861 [Volvox africanus]|uniref:SMODS and SLOG-associating 2TM effector domain-containing protein n=1 Tax=Volvox africanus TaxID=51714 RepID=A0ABQ5S932_9CHLO|nr:hypothetical protein VaNZ11_009861 [Volvox africanus]
MSQHGNSICSISRDPVTKELDETIGLRYWQLFYSVFFWSNFATLMNLVIEILTALTTAKATISGTDPLVHVRGITIALVVLTTINLVLSPANQAANYTGMLVDWRKFGARFETLFYSIPEGEDKIKEKDTALRTLLAEVNTFDAPSIIHPVTEVIATCMIQIWRRHDTKWMQITNPNIYASCDANDGPSSNNAPDPTSSTANLAMTGLTSAAPLHVYVQKVAPQFFPSPAAVPSPAIPPGPGATVVTAADDKLTSTRGGGITDGPSTSAAGGIAPGSSIPLPDNVVVEISPAGAGSAPPAITST